MKKPTLRVRILRVVLLPPVAILLILIRIGEFTGAVYDWLFEYVHKK